MWRIVVGEFGGDNMGSDCCLNDISFRGLIFLGSMDTKWFLYSKFLIWRPHVGLTANTVLKTSQNAAYNAILSLPNSRLDEFIVLKDYINWTVDEFPRNGNEYINKIIIYLDNIVSAAQQILPVETLRKIGIAALDHIPYSFFTDFLGECVNKFNLNAFIGINYDMKMFESFINDRFQRTGMTDLEEDDSCRYCLVEAWQLVNLLLSNQPENLINHAIREKNNNDLDSRL